jgi:hypothetical protein
MRIHFSVGETPVEFAWSWLTGHADLRIGHEVCALQSALDLRSHFSFSRVRTWRHSVDGHQLTIESVGAAVLRPLFPRLYRVVVDGNLVATLRGY